MQRGTAITLSSTNLISPCTRSDGYTNGQNETSFAASKFSVLVLMEKYDKLFLDTEKMSYFSVSVSVFPYFSNNNMCQLSANCFCFAQNFCIDLAFFVFRQSCKIQGGPWAWPSPGFSFLLGIRAVPREIENNAYTKFKGANKLHYGRCASGEWQGDNFYDLCLG